MTMTITKSAGGLFTVMIRRDPGESESETVLFKRGRIATLEEARKLGRAELLKLAPEIRPEDLA
ncbi:MAG: hypothetical protein AAGM38_09860 [Pseudomonadota bacterium]